MLKIVRVQAKPLNLSESTKRLISHGFEALVAHRPEVFNSKLLRVVGVENGAVFKVSPDIEYRDVVGLRSRKNFEEVIPPEDFFQVLSAIALVETADNEKVLVERDSGDWPKSFALPGGFLTADSVEDDFEKFLRERIAKTFSIKEKNIESVSYVELIDFKEICEVMVAFRMKLNLSLEELKAVSVRRVKGLSEKIDLPIHYPSSVALEVFCAKPNSDINLSAMRLAASPSL